MSKKVKHTNKFKNRRSTFIINKDGKLLSFLLETITDKSKNKIKAMLAHHQFMVNNKVITQFNHLLKKGDEVVVSWDRAFSKTNLTGVSIVFEDDDIVVVNKRSGFLSIGSKKERKQTVYQVLTKHIQVENPVARLFVIHRLDRDASGLMVFAKNKKSQLKLQESWNKTLQKRKYLIVAEGTIEKDNSTISSYLRESKALIVYSSNNPKEGKKAVTHYAVFKKNEFYTLLEAWLETERKNQVRVHLKSIGHPIVGDKKYDAKENPLGRMGLHAKVLIFIHPTTEKEVTFETKVPEDFLKLFRRR